MRILIVGRGARRHAIAERLLSERADTEVWCAPNLACRVERLNRVPVPYGPAWVVAGWARSERIDLAVVVSEAELFEGWVDCLTGHGIPCFGPTSAGARIERDRLFAKEVMGSAGIRTPTCEIFRSAAEAHARIPRLAFPRVAKPLSPTNPAHVEMVRDARAASAWIGKVGPTSDPDGFVLEEVKTGREYSVVAFVGNGSLTVWPTVSDHKKAWEGNRGSNTGGMGAHAPAGRFSPDDAERFAAEIFAPVLAEMERLGIRYHGSLTANVIEEDGEPWVLEFNTHVGDPEMSTLLPLLDGSLAELMYCAATGVPPTPRSVVWNDLASVSVTLATNDYPFRGSECGTIRVPDLDGLSDTFLYETGEEGGTPLFQGGRLLSVRGTGATLAEARAVALGRAGEALSRFAPADQRRIRFRRDIGASVGDGPAVRADSRRERREEGCRTGPSDGIEWRSRPAGELA
jgi:phosphoribosylamine---glycine ligase